MAVDVTVVDGDLLLTVEGVHRVLALKGSVRVPLAHVKAIVADAELGREVLAGLKVYGTGLPGYLRAGTWLGRNGLTFWDVHDPGKVVRIDLHDEFYSHIIVEVHDPAAVVGLVNAVLGR